MQLKFKAIWLFSNPATAEQQESHLVTNVACSWILQNKVFMLSALLTVLNVMPRIHAPSDSSQSEGRMSMGNKQCAAELSSRVCDCFNAEQNVSQNTVK